MVLVGEVPLYRVRGRGISLHLNPSPPNSKLNNTFRVWESAIPAAARNSVEKWTRGGSNRPFYAPTLHWRSLESGVLQHKSKQSKNTI